jgi:hypothetical protein
VEEGNIKLLELKNGVCVREKISSAFGIGQPTPSRKKEWLI